MTGGRTKKGLKIVGIVLGSLASLLVVLHFWFVNHAEKIFNNLVRQQSNNHLQAKIGKFSIDYLNLRIDLADVALLPVDAGADSAKVNFSCKKMALEIRNFWDAAWHKNIDIDSILCVSPVIKIYKNKTIQRKKLSLTEEVGDVYLHIQRALNSLHIQRFSIDDGSLQIANSPSDLKPLKLSQIWLSIDNLRIDTGKLDNRPFLFSDNIDLKTGRQDLEWDDGHRTLGFSQLHLNTKRNFLDIKDGAITRTKNDSAAGGSFDIKFAQLRLVNPDLKALYTTGSITADSVYCKAPVVTMDVRVKDSARKKISADHSFEHALHALAGDIYLRHLDVQQADVDISLRKGSHAQSFTSSKNNFSFSDVRVRKHAEEPVFIGHINMSIRNYLSYSADSAMKISFDSIAMLNNRVQLSNFSLNAFPTALHKGSSSIQVRAFEMDKISWTDLLFNKRIVANNAILYQPVISIYSEKNQTAHKASSIYEVIENIGDMAQLEKFRLVNGSVDFRSNKGMSIQLRELNADVNTAKLFQAKNRTHIQDAISALSFRHGNVKSRDMNIEIHNAKLLGFEQSLAIDQVRVLKGDGSLDVQAKGVLVKELSSDSALIEADGVSWKEALVKMKLSAGKKPGATSNKKLLLDLQNIQGANTTIYLQSPKSTISTFIEVLKVPSLTNADGVDVGIGAFIKGNNFRMTGASELSVNAYSILGRGQSSLSGIVFKQYKDYDSVDASLAKLEFIPHIHEISHGNFEFEKILVTNPVIKLSKDAEHTKAGQGTSKKKLPVFNIGQVRIINPIVTLDERRQLATTNILIPVPTAGSPETSIDLTALRTDKNGVLSFKDAIIKLQEFSLHNNYTSFLCRREGNVDVHLVNGYYSPATNAAGSNWAGMLRTLTANYLLLNHTKDGKKLDLVLEKAELDSISLSSSKLKPQDLLESSPHAAVKKLSGMLTTNTTSLSWKNVEYDNYKKHVKVDNFEYSPVQSRDSFLSQAQYEASYMKARVQNIFIENVDLPGYIENKVAKLKKLTIHQPHISIYKDKTLPFNPGNVKPLPVNLIKSIPFRFSLDTLQLAGGHVEYIEKAQKTKLEGSVFLTEVNADLFPLRNYDLTAEDSLSVRATAKLMDTAMIKLRMRESYTDSLAGFVMTVQMPPTDLRILNSMIEPAASVKLVSGQLDTLSMHAVGREYLSVGKMDMKYHKLKLKFLKGGKEGKRTLTTGFITFAANIIVKSRNDRRTGKVFFIRDRHRQIVNYWVKMAISGVATSVGVKHSRKYEKQYLRHLREQGLPPINF